MGFGLRHKSSCPVTPFDNAFASEVCERVARGHQADAVRSCEFPFGVNHIAGLEPSGSASRGFGQGLQSAQIGSSIGVLNLNPNAVQDRANGQFGNCHVGSLRGSSLKTADMNLNKAFPIAEGMNLTFMAQFMNLTNTPIFSIPNTWDDNYSSCEYCTGVRTTGPNGGGSGTVGVYGLMDGSNPGREIELSLKLSF
jgi:hypothetical protein